MIRSRRNRRGIVKFSSRAWEILSPPDDRRRNGRQRPLSDAPVFLSLYSGGAGGGSRRRGHRPRNPPRSPLSTRGKYLEESSAYGLRPRTRGRRPYARPDVGSRCDEDRRPLTPAARTLSPEYRGEGRRRSPPSEFMA